jgi:beta-1,4-mannosyl-glycoprotein beta-1,4-N-acetylglucosaminyltransferase
MENKLLHSKKQWITSIRKMKIYDLFTFNNELDLLEIRLNELDSVVDQFVICESTVTHSNQPKPLYFANNRERFRKFLHKIDLVIFDNVKKTDSWSIENDHRRALSEKIPVNLNDEDILLLSDLDEIPSKKTLEKLKTMDEGQFPVTLCYSMYSGSFHNHVISPENQLHNDSTVAIKYSQYKKNTDLQHYRNIRSQSLPRIYDAGWHFTSMSGPKNVLKKIQSFAHNEYRDSGIVFNEEDIDKNIKEGKDIFGRIGYVIEKVPVNKSFPEYLVKNQDKFKKLIQGNDVETSVENSHSYYLLQHMLYSMKNADYQSSKLDEGYINLKVDGMTCSATKHLANNLASLYKCNYLEVGIYKGATFIAGLWKNNPNLYVGVDNWSEYGGMDEFLEKLKNANKPTVLFDQDSFSEGILDHLNAKFDVYFYDGCHSREAQKLALTHYKKYMKEYFIYYCDDYCNSMDVVLGTMEGISEAGYEIIYDKILLPKSKDSWRNGIYVALLKKN